MATEKRLIDEEFNRFITRPLNKMGGSNILPAMDVDHLMRLALYYIMEIYDLGFHHCFRGSWEWIMLSKGEKGNYLSGEDIFELTPDIEKYNKHKRDFENGIYPPGFVAVLTANNTTEDKKFEYEGQYGWLSPLGKFFESEWGSHEGAAFEIIKKNGWEDDYCKWESDVLHLARDYLCVVKGYVLIDNPSMDGGYNVTSMKPLTKKQKEFLYDYFMAVGNAARANYYMEDKEWN